MPPPPEDPAIRALREYPWRLFWFLLAAALLGLCAAIPYALALFGKTISPGLLSLPMPMFYLVECLQGTLIFGLPIALGLLLARKVGIKAPYLDALLHGRKLELPRGAILAPIAQGLGLGAVVTLLMAMVFLPLLPKWPLVMIAGLPVWKRLLPCFYGAINDVVLIQLFVLSLLLWLLQKLLSRGGKPPAVWIFWTANVLTSCIYAAVHLPTVSKLVDLTASVVAMTFVVNGVAGLVLCYICWKRGLEAAMVAHFCADFVLLVIAPMFL
jgi:hypothetical protein